MSDELFTDKDEHFALDIPKEKRHLNTTAYDYSVSFLFGLMSGDDLPPDFATQPELVLRAVG